MPPLCRDIETEGGTPKRVLPSDHSGKRRSEYSISNGARCRTTPTNRALGRLINWAEICAECRGYLDRMAEIRFSVSAARAGDVVYHASVGNVGLPRLECTGDPARHQHPQGYFRDLKS